MYAVEVVGAGITGSHVAWRLAEAGWRVLLLDRSPRPKPCGGLVSRETLEDFPFLEEYVLNRIDGARIHAGEEMLTLERRGVAYVLDRAALEEGLRERALAAGVEFREEEGPLNEGNVVVGADGAGSATRRMLGLPPVRTVLGVQGTARGSFDTLVDVYFTPLAPGFFAWVIPLDENHARVGLGTRDPSSAVKNLRAFARKLHIRLREVKARPIPVDRPLRRVVYGNVALVGDAVPHTKATTGGGIHYGLLAADALWRVVHEYFSTGSLKSYQRFHGRQLYPKLEMHRLIRAWLERRDMEDVLRAVKPYAHLLEKEGSMDDPTFLLKPKFFPLIFQISVLGLGIPRKQP